MTIFSTSNFHFSLQNESEDSTAKTTISRQQWRAWALKAIQAATQADIHEFDAVQILLRIVDQDEGRTLNKTYRHKDYATNILTFAYGIDETALLSADLILCWPVLLSEAQAQHKSLRHHAAHLLIHGVLHALGYDHENEQDASEMESIEISILKQLKIKNPYIELTN